MEFDYAKLKGKIVEVFGSRIEFAKHIGMSKTTVSHKLSGKRCWTQPEMARVAMALHIDTAEIPEYFFKQKV